MKSKLVKAMAFAIAIMFFAFPSWAISYTSGNIVVSDPFARATAGPARVGGAFLKIHNNGNQTEHLVAIVSSISDQASIHQSLEVNGIMKMRPIDSLEIPPGETVVLKPGSYHVMFMGLKGRLKKGTSFPIRVVFKSGARVNINVPVLGPGAKSADPKR
ncbi:MAG: copper chaperone PCu(A)C [Alphaproteobacteria bacterium]|nr:copper chaperone PCu(A)C [Alphaproteobacteria bacterium]